MQIQNIPIEQITCGKRIRPLNADAVTELAKSIEQIGLLNPIAVREDKQLIAGRHRLEAVKSLGWSTVPANVCSVNELQSRLAEIDENLIRNDLTALEHGEHLAERKEVYEALHPETKRGVAGAMASHNSASDKLSFAEDTAAKTGVSERTVQRDVQIGTAIDEPVRDMIRDMDIADKKTELLKLAQMPKEQQKSVAEKIVSGKAKTVKDAIKQERREDKTQRKQAIPSTLPSISDRYSLYHCAIASLHEHVKAGTVDFIITDPPYPKEYLPVYTDLSRFALHALKPGGSLLAMVGQSFLPEVMERLSDSLNYQWIHSYLTPGGQSPQIWDRKVNTFWKPVLWYVKGEYEGDWHGDVVQSDQNDNDKRFHHWGQSESGMSSIIEKFTYPGNVICDPFLGGGTTAVVAVRMNRLFIGADNSEESLTITKRRLNDVTAG